jgi:hypothetical protein
MKGYDPYKIADRGNIQLPVSIPSFFALRSGITMASIDAIKNA